MGLEDLQSIVAETAHKLQGRKVHMLLAAAVLLVILTLLALLIGIIYLGATSCTTEAKERTCMTPGCLKVSAWLSKSMDPSVDACDNFYQFACGGWIQDAGVPTTDRISDISHQLELDNQRKWKEILESPIVSSNSDSAERKVKDFFKMCLHDYGRMKDGGRTLVNIIRNELHGWYVFDPENWQQNWNFDDAIVTAHTEYLIPALFNYYVWPDTRDVNNNILTIYPAFLGMSTYDYENEDREELRNNYKAYIRTLGGYLIRDADLNLDNDTTTQRLDQFVDDIMEMETRLARIKRQAGRASWWAGTVSTLREMGRNFTQVDYVDIFTHMFRDADVTVSTEILLTSPNYFRLLDDMLEEEGDDKDRLLNNYLIWTFVSQSATYLSWEYKYARYQYIENRWGVTEFPSTWKSCMSLVRRRFTMALATLFYKKHIGDNVEHKVEEMTTNVKTTLLADVDTIPWMDNATKPFARHKVSSMEVDVGFPPQYQDEDEVNRMYSHLNIDPDESFFQNLVYMNEFTLYQAGQDLKGSYRNNLWRYEVMHDGYGVRPYYYWFYNAVMIPPGGMQFPIYSNEVPMAYNYGAMGTRLANGMVHSIDSIGRLIANGTFNTWWTEGTFEAYKASRQCVYDYYGNQTAGPYMIDGEEKSTKIEGRGYQIKAVARMAGLRVAYQTYQRWSVDNRELPLPGMNMTNDQLFFLAAVQTRCAVQPDQNAFDRAKSGYLPEEILMNGLISHSDDFQRIYKCPQRAKMNPQKKCRIF